MKQPDTAALRERLANYTPEDELGQDKQELEGLLQEVNYQLIEFRNLMKEIKAFKEELHDIHGSLKHTIQRERTAFNALVAAKDSADNIVDGITASVRWRTGLINNYAPHECADLVEAMPDAENIQQVFFPGQADIKEFSAAGDPAFIAWNGIPIGIKFTNIAQNSGVITFDIIEDNTEILLTPTNCHIKAFQNKAIAEWECGRPGNYPWSIIWGRTDISSTAVRDTSYSCRYTFNNLEPRAEYRCMIFHIGKQQNGDTAALHFSTSALTSPYPYIVLDKRSYSKGDTLDLALNNLTEDLSSCIWYINGNRVTTDRYIFKTVGTYKIQAVLVYAADGSNESITRTLHVKEAVLPENDEDF